MSGNVLPDAQMSMFRTLRPMNNFEAVYQGQSATIPIAFPCEFDPSAGETGFDANLLKGVPVPLGARVQVQIPIAIAMYTIVTGYAYQFIWRTRNQGDVNRAMAEGRQPSAYHLPHESLGRGEVGVAPAFERYFIPGASDIEVFEQGESALVGGAGVLNVRPQRYVPLIDPPWVQPLLPSGAAGVWQQGVYQFSSNVNCAGPTFAPLWLDSCGDELLILCYKTDAAENTWDFTDPDEDLAFSNTYGNNNAGLPNNPNIGILLSTGVMGG